MKYKRDKGLNSWKSHDLVNSSSLTTQQYKPHNCFLNKSGIITCLHFAVNVKSEKADRHSHHETDSHLQ